MRSSSARKMLGAMLSVATLTAMACGGTDALSAGLAVTGGLEEAEEPVRIQFASAVIDGGSEVHIV